MKLYCERLAKRSVQEIAWNMQLQEHLLDATVDMQTLLIGHTAYSRLIFVGVLTIRLQYI